MDSNLKNAMSAVRKIQRQLEEISNDMIGQVDDKTLCQYNALVKDTEHFMNRLNFLASNNTADTSNGQRREPTTPLWLLGKKKMLSARPLNALTYAGFHTVKDLTYVTIEQLEKVDKLGSVGIAEIINYCNKNGIRIGSNAERIPEYSKGDTIKTIVSKSFGLKEIHYPAGTRAVVTEKVQYAKKADTFTMVRYRCIPVETTREDDYLILTPSEMEMA